MWSTEIFECQQFIIVKKVVILELIVEIYKINDPQLVEHVKIVDRYFN